MNPILSVEELTIRFNTPRGEVPAVEGVSFSLNKGEIFALLGETGCGKSVICRTIIGLPGDNAYVSGTIRYKGKNLLSFSETEFSNIRGNAVTIILQNPDLALNPIMPIGHQLMEPLKRHWP